MSETNTVLARALRDVGVVPNGRPWQVAKEMLKAGSSLDVVVATVVQGVTPDERLKPKSLGCSDLSCTHGRCQALRSWGERKGITAPKAKKAKAAKATGTKKAKKAAPVQAPVESEAAALVAKLADRPEVVALLQQLLS